MLPMVQPKYSSIITPNGTFKVVRLHHIPNLQPVEIKQLKELFRLIQSIFHRALGFDHPFELCPVTGMDILGGYSYGTHRAPLIMVDLGLIKDYCLRENLDVNKEVSITVVHEIGHAYQDRLGILDETDAIESAAESFAQIWTSSGEIHKEILVPVSMF